MSEPPDDVAWVIEVFEHHADRVFTLALRILWDWHGAQDVVQWTFVRAWGRRDQLRDPMATRAWLLKIAYRLSLQALRTRRDVPTDPSRMPEPGSEPADEPEAAALATDEVRRLVVALAAVPETLRAALVLRDVQELPMAQVAEVLGVGLSAAKMRVHRGREALRAAYFEGGSR